jgi:dolichol kinase
VNTAGRHELPLVVIGALRATAIPLLVSYRLVHLDTHHLRVAAVHFHEVFHKVTLQPFLSLFWIEFECFTHLAVHVAGIKFVKKVCQKVEELFAAKLSELALANFALFGCLPVELLVKARNDEISPLPLLLGAPHGF